MAMGCTSWYSVLFGLYAFTDGSWHDSDLRQLLMPPLLGLATAAVATAYERSARCLASRAAVLVTAALVLAVSAIAIAGLLFALPGGLPRLPGWWNLPAAVVWALLAFVAARTAAGRDGPAPTAELTDDAWEREVAGRLRVRGRHTDTRIRDVLHEARAQTSGTGLQLAERLGPPDDYAEGVPAQPGVASRRSAWHHGMLAVGILLLAAVRVSEGGLGWLEFLSGALALLLAGSAYGSWRRSRTAGLH